MYIDDTQLIMNARRDWVSSIENQRAKGLKGSAWDQIGF
jgi:hypothetical protein